MKARHNAFTTIELMVAIGILIRVLTLLMEGIWQFSNGLEKMVATGILIRVILQLKEGI